MLIALGPVSAGGEIGGTLVGVVDVRPRGGGGNGAGSVAVDRFWELWTSID